MRPTVAFPHLRAMQKTIDEIEAMEPIKIDQVVIGSCTNEEWKICEGSGNLKRAYGTSGCACDGHSGNSEDLQTVYQRRAA